MFQNHQLEIDSINNYRLKEQVVPSNAYFTARTPDSLGELEELRMGATGPITVSPNGLELICAANGTTCWN